MDIILIPGLWLDGSSWDEVVPALEQAGHRTHALTVPGMESKDADRPRITLCDHVDAVDARPDRVVRAVYIGGFPTGDGLALVDGFPVENGEVPLPDRSDFEERTLSTVHPA